MNDVRDTLDKSHVDQKDIFIQEKNVDKPCDLTGQYYSKSHSMNQGAKKRISGHIEIDQCGCNHNIS